MIEKTHTLLYTFIVNNMDEIFDKYYSMTRSMV